jgi:hypothetical protein
MIHNADVNGVQNVSANAINNAHLDQLIWMAAKWKNGKNVETTKKLKSKIPE